MTTVKKEKPKHEQQRMKEEEEHTPNVLIHLLVCVNSGCLSMYYMPTAHINRHMHSEVCDE